MVTKYIFTLAHELHKTAILTLNKSVLDKWRERETRRKRKRKRGKENRGAKNTTKIFLEKTTTKKQREKTVRRKL